MANYVGYEKRMLSVKWDYSSASNASLYRVMRINSETLGQDVRSSLNKINAWTDLTTHDLERLYLTFPSDIIHTVKLVMDQMPMPDENDETLRQLSNQVEFLRDDPSLVDMTELQSAVDTINQQQAKARVDSEHVRKLIVDLETKFIDYIKAATLE